MSTTNSKININFELLKILSKAARPFSADPHSKKDAKECDESSQSNDPHIDEYAHFEGAGFGSGSTELEQQTELHEALEKSWWFDPQKTFEDEVSHVSARNTNSLNKTLGVVPPCVVSRGSSPMNHMCWACGANSAWDLQTPQEIYATAFTALGEAKAIENLKEFAKCILCEGSDDYEKAIERTAVCRKVKCMLAQYKLSSEEYEAWVNSPNQRAQLERGTERKGQSLVFFDNIGFLRILAVQNPPIFSKAEISAMFQWVVFNSRFVQEREKRFIATAMAIVESSTFGFKFPDAQSFVDRMGCVPRNYANTVVLNHIFNDTMTPKRWQSAGNRILETACPKAPDVAFAFMCEANARGNGNYSIEGRIEHTVPIGAAYADLFTVSGFGDALSKAVKENSSYLLYFQSRGASSSGDASKAIKDQSREDTNKLLKLVSGNQRCYVVSNGVNRRHSYPTCGGSQDDSGVHTYERYMSIFRSEGYSESDAREKVDTFIDQHKAGNTVGREKLQGKKADKTKSKACAAIRPVKECAPRELLQTSRARASARALISKGSTVMIKRRAVNPFHQHKL